MSPSMPLVLSCYNEELCTKILPNMVLFENNQTWCVSKLPFTGSGCKNGKIMVDLGNASTLHGVQCTVDGAFEKHVLAWK